MGWSEKITLHRLHRCIRDVPLCGFRPGVDVLTLYVAGHVCMMGVHVYSGVCVSLACANVAVSRYPLSDLGYSQLLAGY